MIAKVYRYMCHHVGNGLCMYVRIGYANVSDAFRTALVRYRKAFDSLSIRFQSLSIRFRKPFDSFSIRFRKPFDTLSIRFRKPFDTLSKALQSLYKAFTYPFDRPLIEV
jgi:hypothetical protein